MADFETMKIRDVLENGIDKNNLDWKWLQITDLV